MNKIKEIIKQNFQGFAYFYSNLRYRVFIAMALSLTVGVLDGLGLSMFLPLLQMVDGSEQVNSEALGELSFVVEGLRSLGISLNLMSVLIIMVIFFLFKGIAKFINFAYRIVIQQYFIRQLREQLLKYFNKITYSYFVKSDVGRIQNTMSGEVERVSRSFQEYFKTIEEGILVVVYMVFAFLVDAQFALLVTIGGWLTNFLYSSIYKSTKGASKKFTKDSHLYQGQIIQHVANFKYLKATASLHKYASKLLDSISKIEYNRKKMGILSALLEAAREPLLMIIVAGVILIQTKVLDAPLGPILMSLLFFYRALTSLVIMQNSWNRFLMVSGSLDNVMGFQDEIQHNSEKRGKFKLERFDNKIELSDTWFSYDGKEFILKRINLNVHRNEAIAFVGESGSGKTTLINIMTGLMPPSHGVMTIDGIERSELNIESYQKRIGYITQEPVIFNDTVYNNITFWSEKTELNIQKFKTALQKAAILEFVNELPEGENTVLGNNGINLSGGQKQRISIARELYKEVDILVMDEATSALDSETERSIQQNIDRLKGQFTMLVIAHRLSTIRNVDRVVFMRKGEIVDEGTFDQLVDRLPQFRQMVELQEI